MNVVTVLKERGLLQDTTSPNLERRLDEPITLYAGFDPTSSSLQAGNLVTLIVMKHFLRCGHRVIGLAGGATGMIGDPSGKENERSLLSREAVDQNVQGIRENIERILLGDVTDGAVTIVNNADWLAPFGVLDFLRDVGKHFRVGAMLGKESVRARLAAEAGMSFTEFSYQLLQAYDFLRLYDDQGCVLQIGGSDQWGNITAGIDLIRKLRSVEAYGLTFPLICDSQGQKFGKSEGNAVYLSADRTSTYDFYQFFVRAADADVERYLKIFTFLSLEEIAGLMEALKTAPGERAAQKRLAEEVTRMVHGEQGLATARGASRVLFGESVAGLKAEELLGIFRDVSSTEIPRADVESTPVFELAAKTSLCKSRGEARRLIDSGGLYLNNVRVDSIDRTVDADDIIDGRLLVLRSGKKNFHLVRVV